MATPQSPADGEAPKRNLEQITFRFCSECSNMLYPKEDEDAHKLQFTCRTCQYTEEATSSCVFRNVMNNAAGETAGVTQDVGSDPTVRSHISSCHASDASASAPAAPVANALAAMNSPSARSGASDSIDSSLALCLRCGVTLLHCNCCNDPASVDEYNDYVQCHPDFAVTRSMHYVRLASYFNSLDTESQAAWDTRFASCGGMSLAHLSQDGISQFLPLDIAMNPYADPPEALSDGDNDGMDNNHHGEILT